MSSSGCNVYSERYLSQVAMEPRTKRFLVWSAGILGSFLLVGLLLPVSHRPGKFARILITRAQIQGFDTACRVYESDCGRYPSGTLSEIMSALNGNNPHGLVFFQIETGSLNQAGEPIDQWKTPFRLAPAADNAPPQLISAGPDRYFGTKMTSLLTNRVLKNDFLVNCNVYKLLIDKLDLSAIF